jgi:phosphate:Na+ symporter
MSIAIVHTTFNLLTTAALLPFSRGLEKLACMTLKDDKDTTDSEDTINGLDERFLASPGYAVDQCSEVTKQMAELAKDTILSSIQLLTKYDDKISTSIMENENRVDKYEDVLGTYLVKLSSKELSLSNSNSVSMFLHSIGDLERISDHAVNILDLAKEINQKSINFSKDAQDGLNVMTSAVIDILNMTIKAFVTDDLELAKKIEPLEEVIDLLRKDLKDRHIRRLQKGQCTTELGFVYTDILTNFERVSDHCSNIAVSMLQLNENSFDTHEYLHDVKFKGERYFTEQFEANKKKYALPEANE